MNTNTGEIRSLTDITKGEWKSGEWVEIPDEAARCILEERAVLQAEIERLTAKLKD